MASYAGPLVRGPIPTVAAMAYTVPSTYNTTAYNAAITVVAFTNTTSSALSVTLNIVPAGSSAQTGNQLYGAQLIAPNTMSYDAIPIPLSPGDQIVWGASGAGLNGYIGGTLNGYTGVPS